MKEFLDSAVLMLGLLNPFLIVIYLIEPLKKLSTADFAKLLFYASLIAFSVFGVFAVSGEFIFRHLVQAEFASFQVFGGIIFLLVGIKFILQGGLAIEQLRGDKKPAAESIAIPILVGPGTISAAVVIGKRLDAVAAVGTIGLAVFTSMTIIILLKALHDYAQPRNEVIVQKYIDIAGRILALYVGTVSVEMIFRGTVGWLRNAEVLSG